MTQGGFYPQLLWAYRICRGWQNNRRQQMGWAKERVQAAGYRNHAIILPAACPSPRKQ